jgi:hypothetical protein
MVRVFSWEWAFLVRWLCASDGALISQWNWNIFEIRRTPNCSKELRNGKKCPTQAALILNWQSIGSVPLNAESELGAASDVISCIDESYVSDLRWESSDELTVHEKAVPAMIGGLRHQTLSWRNGKWPTQGSVPASDGEPSR